MPYLKESMGASDGNLIQDEELAYGQKEGRADLFTRAE